MPVQTRSMVKKLSKLIHKKPPRRYCDQYKWLCDNNLIVSAEEAFNITGINVNTFDFRKSYYDNLMPENRVIGTPFWFNENKRYAIAPEGYYWKALYNKEDKELFRHVGEDFYATAMCMEFGLAIKENDYKPYEDI